jgi:transposase
MELYGAIDLHSNNNVIVLLDKEDRVIYEKRLVNNLEIILHELKPYQSRVEALAVESTFNWYWLVDGLIEAGYDVRLVNTSAVKQYEGLKYTDDSHDARWLAHLLRLGILPEGYIYPAQMRAVRDLLRKRSQLVRQKTAHVLSIQNLHSRNTGQSISANRVRRLRMPEIEKVFSDENRVMALRSNVRMMKYSDSMIEKKPRQKM